MSELLIHYLLFYGTTWKPPLPPSTPPLPPTLNYTTSLSPYWHCQIHSDIERTIRPNCNRASQFRRAGLVLHALPHILFWYQSSISTCSGNTIQIPACLLCFPVLFGSCSQSVLSYRARDYIHDTQCLALNVLLTFLFYLYFSFSRNQ